MNLLQMIDECTQDSERWFPGNQDLAFTTLAMAGEVGEVANIVKKVVRGSHELEVVLDDLTEEVVDVLIYLCNLMGAKEFDGVDWSVIWDRKRRFNENRFAGQTTTPTEEYFPPFAAPDADLNPCGLDDCGHAPDGGNHPVVLSE
jgi:NTP pyrophosphatase (non-canonical NTP hydrolase)